MRVFGIDPGSETTGYGCVESAGGRHRLVVCGAVRAGAGATFADRLSIIFRSLTALLAECRPDCVVVENLFHATNARSALKLGHARGVALLAAVEFGVPVAEYTPAEVKRAVVGYGRAEKAQVGQMVKLLLGLDKVPAPHDAADALAVAICHIHQGGSKLDRIYASTEKSATNKPGGMSTAKPGKNRPGPISSWRKYRPPAGATRT